MAAERKLCDELEKYYLSFCDNSRLVPLSGVRLKPLFMKGGHSVLEFPLDFLGEIIILSRGPIALISKDKWIIRSSGMPGVLSVERAFWDLILVRTLKKDFVPPLMIGVERKVLKGIPLAKPWVKRNVPKKTKSSKGRTLSTST